MLCDGVGPALLPAAVAVAKQLHVLRWRVCVRGDKRRLWRVGSRSALVADSGRYNGLQRGGSRAGGCTLNQLPVHHC